MAKSVKIEALVGGLENYLPVLGRMLDTKNLSSTVTEDTDECKMIVALVAAVDAYNAAKLTTAQEKELGKLKTALADLDAKHDEIQSDLIVADAKMTANWAAKMKPVDLVAAVTKATAAQAKSLEKLQAERRHDQAETAEKIGTLENLKAIRALDAAKTALGYTDGTSRTSSHKIGEAEFLILDLLKTKPYHGQFRILPSRAVQFMPVKADWQAAGQKIGTWQNVGYLADTDALKSQTNLQRWAYEFVNRFDRAKSMEENTERVNRIFVDGSPTSIGVNGQCGGTAQVHVVSDRVLENVTRQITSAAAQEKYQFIPEPVVLVVEEDAKEEDAK